MAASTVLLDSPAGASGVTVITLNRPEALNSWDWLMSAEMNHAFGEFDRDDDVRAIVLTGAGRAFCAGAGLLPAGRTFDGSLTRDAAEAKFPGPHKGADRLRTPVIAAVNGAAVGAGGGGASCVAGS